MSGVLRAGHSVGCWAENSVEHWVAQRAGRTVVEKAEKTERHLAVRWAAQ